MYAQQNAQPIQNELLLEHSIFIRIWREDLNHPFISGNKWWKLKYNLDQAGMEGHTQILTFGGAYSNHLYATAAAASELGFKSIGIVRGDERRPLNPTLEFCKSKGMILEFISREQYRKKYDESFLAEIRNRFGSFYQIPEGGTNLLAVKGCEEWATLMGQNETFDYLCVPVGTTGTMAGMVNQFPDKKVIGFSSLKGGAFLKEEILQWIKHKKNNWQIITDYHFGGYGKLNNQLRDFIKDFEKIHGIPLDPVYTSKMMFGVFNLVQKGFFPAGSRVLVLHTGGLQGRSGFSF